jgi:hypothetical protein
MQALNQCSANFKLYPALAESEPQNTPLSPVDTVPLPKKWIENNGKITRNNINFCFKNQLDARLKEKQRKTGNLIARANHTGN